MGATNHGTQDITYNYYEEATAEDFNKRHLGIRPRGIYEGGYLTKVNDSEITLSPFTLEIGDNNEQISSKSSANATLKSTTLDSGDISSATPYIILRWAFAELVGNFVEVHAIASIAAAQTNDIIVGKCLFSGATLTGFDYSDRTFLNIQNLFLRVETSSGLYVQLRAGRIQDGSQCIAIPETKVGPFNVPGAPNSRIDLVYIDTDGTVTIEQGVQAVSPVAPDYEDKLVVAEVKIVNGDASIPADRITDVRIFITSVPITPDYGDIFGNWTNLDSLSNVLIKDTVYKAGSAGFVVAYDDSAQQNSTVVILTDGNNPPVKTRTDDWNNATGKCWGLCPVKKNDYWKVTGTATIIHWLPIGSGTCVKQ